VKEVR